MNKKLLYPLLALVLAILACTNNLPGSASPPTEDDLSDKTTDELVATVVADMLGTPESDDNGLTPKGWDVKFFNGATDQMHEWMAELNFPVTDWEESPNMDSPSHDFLAKNGVYWYAGQNYYCQQDQRCDLNNPARSLRVVTGDYQIEDHSCTGSVAGTGCTFIWINVGDVNAMYRNVKVDYGWTESGPYFNGDEMAQTLWAVSSHVSYNMLNTAGGTNVGGNCSVADGCHEVDMTIIITSGNQLLVIATTTVTR